MGRRFGRCTHRRPRAAPQPLHQRTSTTLIAEFEDVLGREKLLERIIRVGSSVPDLLGGYRALAQIVRTTEMARQPGP